MFHGCTSLKELPAGLLPATTLATYCYYGMFYGCKALTFIYMTVDWFSKTPAQGSMFYGCPKIAANTSYADIPSGWK
jgi:hypothetical protein